MRLCIDTDSQRLTIEDGTGARELPLYSKEAFYAVARQWLRICWNQKYTYTFTWLGRPMVQLPDDVLRLQEVIWTVKPDVIVETGVAHGGSLVFHASLCHAIGKGRVMGVDVEIRPHNRRAIEDHPMSKYIQLVEGDSVGAETIGRVHAAVHAGETVLVILDSNHTKTHVLAELEGYHDLVGVGSYIVATDGIMQDLDDVPRGQRAWANNNPAAAARDFAERHSDFTIEEPTWQFNESDLNANVTHWPGAYLRRTGPR
jgi:cephalosporin hydroxylase